MKPFALSIAALLLSALPALAQSEVDKLKEEVQKLKVETAAKAARIAELQALLDKEKSQHDLRAAARSALEGVRAVPATPAPAPATPHIYGITGFVAKVTAVADQIGLVILSSGSDDGVAEGDEFVITRLGQFVAKVTIDRVDKKWSAGKVTQKSMNPQAADDATRNAKNPQWMSTVTTQPGKVVTLLTPTRVPADEVQSLRKELDEVRAQVRQLTDRLVPSYQGPGVSVEEAPEELRSHLGLLRGLLVRRVREGSAAEKAGLKANDVVPDLLEAQLVEALESGMPIHVVRQGARVRLPGAKGR